MTHPKTLLLASVLLASPILARPAAAHAILVDSTPAAGASLAPGEVAFRLHYNSRIDRARSRLSLVRPDAAEAALPIAADTALDVLATTAKLPAGRYTLRWQVLAIDGHITRGDLPFTVAAP